MKKTLGDFKVGDFIELIDRRLQMTSTSQLKYHSGPYQVIYQDQAIDIDQVGDLTTILGLEGRCLTLYSSREAKRYTGPLTEEFE